MNRPYALNRALILTIFMLGGFLNPIPSLALTVFETEGNAGFINVDFANCSPQPACQSDQYYVSLSDYIPIGTTFDRVQIKFANNTVPRVFLNVFRDEGDLHFTCDGSACFSDDVLIYDIVEGSASKISDGIYQFSFTDFTATTSLNYFYITIDPNAPLQTVIPARSTDGFIQDGNNNNRQSGSYQMQLCDNTCDTFGSFSQNSNFSFYNIINKPTPYGTTTATTSVDIDITFNSQSGIDFAPAQNAIFRIYDAVTNNLEYEYVQFFEPNTNFNYNYSTTTVLTEGSKILKTVIQNATNGSNLSIEKDVFFNVITNTYLLATGLESPLENPADLTQIDCDLFDVGCQFQKALTFLLLPSDDVLNRYSSLWQQIRNKVPFGYVTVVIDQLNELDDSATPAFSFGTIPFMSIIFTPFQLALSLILWGIYAVYFYRYRLTTLDI